MNANKVQGLKVKAGIKAGGIQVINHSRTTFAIRVKSGVKAGQAIFLKNHNGQLR